MNPKINYTLVGLFVVLLIGAGLTLSALMTRDSRSQERVLYYTFFYDSVSGLNERAPVRYNGVPIGYVESIRLVTEPQEAVRLGLRIDADAPVRSNTYASLQHQGITGLLFVELKNRGERGDRLATHATNPTVIPSQGSRLVELAETLDQSLLQFNQLAESLILVSQQLGEFTNAEMHQHITGLLQATEQLMATAESRLQDFQPQPYQELALNLTALSERLAQELPASVSRLERQTLAHLQQLSTQITLVAQDTRSSSRQLLPLLHHAEELLEQLQQEGRSWLRNHQTRPAGPGE